MQSISEISASPFLPTDDWSTQRTRLVHEPARSDYRCRCGTRIPTGRLGYRFEQLPPSLVGMLEGEAFCHVLCVRAWILEAIESVEGNGREAVVTDLRELYCTLQELLNLMQAELEGEIIRAALLDA